MAYMSQERKNEIAKQLKTVMPQGWKYSLAVRHHSTIVLTISAAPLDLLGIYQARAAKQYESRFGDKYQPSNSVNINPYHLDSQFEGEILETFKRILRVLNAGNHDRSDLQTDYFDVGWYVDIQIGRWDKPFQAVAA